MKSSTNRGPQPTVRKTRIIHGLNKARHIVRTDIIRELIYGTSYVIFVVTDGTGGTSHQYTIAGGPVSEPVIGMT